MHFIGNRAIILGDGAAAVQLVYNPGYSTLSVFLPIIGLMIAFAAAELQFPSPTLRWLALTCTGVFAGLSVVGMHYIGNFGISNYSLRYVPQYLAASVVIAIGDCLAVLMLFFHWRDQWISDWWKRLLCAVALAGGVSAMHFTASTNCIYQLKHYNSDQAIKSRDVQVIIAGALCGTAGCITLCGMFLMRRRKGILKKSSQKVMLACAMFHPDGRVLVTTAGALPSREITEKYNHRTFEEDFDTAHPVFQWIFRVTHNWSAVADLIPKMKSHLGDDGAASSRPGSSKSSSQYDPDTNSDYSIFFRERFCTATASLATWMHITVENIGILYDRIIETDTLQPEDRTIKRQTLQKSGDDPEKAERSSIFGKGQLLLLTRQLDHAQTGKVLTAGDCRFASVQQVAHSIAESLQIPIVALEAHMVGVETYVKTASSTEKAGTWLNFFAIIPKVNSKGFDIVVKKAEQGHLPDTPLLPTEPTPRQAQFLQRLDGLDTAECMTFLANRNRRDSFRSPEEHSIAMTMLRAMTELDKQLPSAWFQSARFVGKPVYANYSQTAESPCGTTMYSLVVCADLHTSIEPSRDIVKVPMSFFSARQQCYAGSPNKQVLEREIHQEFSPLLTRKGVKNLTSRERMFTLHRSRASSTRRPSAAHSGSEHSDPGYASDTHELVEKPRHTGNTALDATAGAERDDIWGGILVNSETVIKSDSKQEGSTNISTHDLGTKVAVGTSKPEATFVDELFAAACQTVPSKSN